MRFTERINKPEYLYRPSQLIRRIAQALLPEPETVEVMLPWGLRMRVRPGEDQGRAIWRLGVYDLVVSEALWRLLDPGETAIDAGASIGYMTGLMAARIGSNGSVLAFEPHPRIFAELASNVAGWVNQPIAHTTPLELALSSKNGSSWLSEPVDFDRNCGTSKISADEASGRRIETVCLDKVCAEYGSAEVLKLDVEGHELEVLRGAPRLLETDALRDIIFEEHSRSFKSPVASMLSDLGYTIFILTRSFTGPALTTEPGCFTVPYLPPNFLATRDPERAVARLHTGGWHVLL
jgi:FkbM family methyltransferase